MHDLQKVMLEGVNISSSGTTSIPKNIYRSPKNLQECINVALDAQKITKKSKILTVTRMTHAGGLLTQTLPAYSIGAKFKVQPFNAYTFLKDFKEYTHTFLAPAQMTALMHTKGFQNADLTGKHILGGSDPVSWGMIEEFVKRGAIVQPNWGMTEIGPITINTTFDNIDMVHEYKNKYHTGTILGDTYYCDWKIENNVLYVKGPTCVFDGWFKTNDLVKQYNGATYYQGRNPQ